MSEKAASAQDAVQDAVRDLEALKTDTTLKQEALEQHLSQRQALQHEVKDTEARLKVSMTESPIF